MSKIFSDYKQFKQDIEKYKLEDDAATYIGFTLALLVQGRDPTDKFILDKIREVLNFDSALPGAIIAHITSFSIKSKALLDDKNLYALFLDKEDGSVQALDYIAKLCYGLTLGMIHCDKSKSITKSQNVKDSFDLFSAITELDCNSEFDDKSFHEVKDAVIEAIYLLNQ